MIRTTSRAGEHRSDGRATRWDSHRASRRAELVHAARRAVHHQGADISMDEIAAEIGTSKSILYRYFTDKAGLQAAVGQAVLEGLREALEGAASSAGRPRERLEAMVAVYLEMVEQSPSVYDFVTRPEAEAAAGALRGFVADTEEMVAELVLPVLRELPLEGRDDRALARLWGAGLVGFVRAVAERWFGNREDRAGERGDTAVGIAGIDRTRLTDLITDWLWDGAVGVARRSPRDDAGRSPRDDAGRSPRDDARRSPRDDAGRSPRDDAGRSPRDDARSSPRDGAPEAQPPGASTAPRPERSTS